MLAQECPVHPLLLDEHAPILSTDHQSDEPHLWSKHSELIGQHLFELGPDGSFTSRDQYQLPLRVEERFLGKFHHEPTALRSQAAHTDRDLHIRVPEHRRRPIRRAHVGPDRQAQGAVRSGKLIAVRSDRYGILRLAVEQGGICRHLRGLDPQGPTTCEAVLGQQGEQAQQQQGHQDRPHQDGHQASGASFTSHW